MHTTNCLHFKLHPSFNQIQEKTHLWSHNNQFNDHQNQYRVAGVRQDEAALLFYLKGEG